MTLRQIRAELAELGDPDIAAHSARYFQAGPGQYGEGDRFRGIRVPVLRKLAHKYREITVTQAGRLLQSPHHEDRLLALFILVWQFQKGDRARRERIYRLYLANTTRVNNWDLVDSSARHIVGGYLSERDKGPLLELARSELLWERRIAIMATGHFIGQGRFDDTLRLAEMLLTDSEDLIHKAVGWMLREVGNRDREAEEAFLQRHYRAMPRVMLRYAIERFPEERRRTYLEGRV